MRGRDLTLNINMNSVKIEHPSVLRTKAMVSRPHLLDLSRIGCTALDVEDQTSLVQTSHHCKMVLLKFNKTTAQLSFRELLNMDIKVI